MREDGSVVDGEDLEEVIDGEVTAVAIRDGVGEVDLTIEVSGWREGPTVSGVTGESALCDVV